MSCSDSKRLEKDPIIENISAKVSTAEIEKTITDLVAFETRFPYQKQIEVADYLYNRLKVYITSLDFHEYEFWGVNWKNVIGTIPGKIYPREYVIVSAHLDTKSEKRLVYAPGADDNASGCAAVMELARILSKYSFEKSIKFIFFSREETGWEGSAAYLKSVDRNKEKIIAAINLDMIAYGGDDEDIDLVTRPKYAWLAEEINDLARLSGFTTRKVIDKHCF
jgi:acetylornithine deacetylase/succinyl-diaminopimelate desuccinylase-like protein